MMGRHPFNFEGGSKLTTMGATWFVSYAYHTHIDPAHMNWENVGTHQNRMNTFRNTTQYHRYWLEKVLEMGDKRLNTNTIGLKANRIKEMARQLLASMAARG